MKELTVYELWTGDQLRLSSLSREEIEDMAQLIFDNDKILAEIRDYERTPVDHTKEAK